MEKSIDTDEYTTFISNLLLFEGEVQNLAWFAVNYPQSNWVQAIASAAKWQNRIGAEDFSLETIILKDNLELQIYLYSFSKSMHTALRIPIISPQTAVNSYRRSLILGANFIINYTKIIDAKLLLTPTNSLAVIDRSGCVLNLKIYEEMLQKAIQETSFSFSNLAFAFYKDKFYKDSIRATFKNIQKSPGDRASIFYENLKKAKLRIIKKICEELYGSVNLGIIQKANTDFGVYELPMTSKETYESVTSLKF